MGKPVTYVPLAPAECWSLLRGSAVGRVAYTSEALPAIALVNYAIVGDLVVFGVGERSKLAGLLTGQVAAFEVDDVDPATGTGWSVLIVGRAARISDAVITQRVPRLATYPSSVDGPEAYVGLTGERTTGRVWDGFAASPARRAVWEIKPDCDDAQSG